MGGDYHRPYKFDFSFFRVRIVKNKSYSLRAFAVRQPAPPARAGEPPARVPHAKTVRRTVLPPLLRFCKGRDFALCTKIGEADIGLRKKRLPHTTYTKSVCADAHPKMLSLDSAAFEKAGEILLSGRQFVKNFLFRPTGNFLNHGDSPCNCPQNLY